jgi:uncharacterized protein (DUF2147 family)
MAATFFLVLAVPAVACGEKAEEVMVTSNPDLQPMQSSSKRAPIAGLWHTPEKEATIKIYLAKDGMYYGELVAAKNPKAKPGLLILRKLKEKDGKWAGKLFAAKHRRIVDVAVQPDGAKLKLTVSAMGRTKTIHWTPAD